MEQESEAILTCIGCGLGKMHKDPHHTKTWESKKLDLIHTDLCGPMDTATLLYGKSYIITFIDDYSRRSWIELLAHKDEALDSFKRWLPLVERES